MQGGDLIKWDKAKVGYYVGVDIAEGSVSFVSYRTRRLCTIRASNMYSCMFCI
jgi:hypothetical protein